MGEQAEATRSWSDMAARERDALVAEKVMGWVKNPPGVRGMGWKTPEGCFVGLDGYPLYTETAAYLQVEGEIKRRGLGGEYLAFLFGMFNISLYSMGEYTDHDYDGVFKVWSATPEQRCYAALRAVGVKI